MLDLDGIPLEVTVRMCLIGLAATGILAWKARPDHAVRDRQV